MQELIQFYTEMSVDEFEDYILQEYQKTVQRIKRDYLRVLNSYVKRIKTGTYG